MNINYYALMAICGFFACFPLNIQGQCVNDGIWNWATHVNGNGSSTEWAYAMEADSNGYLYVVGTYDGNSVITSTQTGGNQALSSIGGKDIYLAKYDSTGALLWVEVAGSSGEDDGFGLAVSSGGDCYITGRFFSPATFGGSVTLSPSGQADSYLAKYDASGTFQWIRQVSGSGHDFGWSMDMGPDGNIYFTGGVSGSITFESSSGPGQTINSAGDHDMFIAKYNPAGTLIWVTSAGGSGYERGNCLRVGDNGKIYVVGNFQGTATFGSYSINSNGAWDMYTTAYDSTGTCLWVNTMGSSSDDFGRAVAIDAAGAAYVTGRFNGTANVGTQSLTSAGGSDMYIIKYDEFGATQWANRYGSLGFDQGFGAVINSLGDVFISGNFQQTVDFGGADTLTSVGGQDVFALKVDKTSGNIMWASRAGGGTAYVTGMGADLNGKVYVLGSHSGFFDVPPAFSTSGGSTGYIAQVEPISSGEIFYSDISDTICSGSTYSWLGNTYTMAGTYSDTTQSVLGCDSVFTLNLHTLADATSFLDTVCKGTFYAWQGGFYDTSGTYSDTLTGAGGCDSVISLILHASVNPTPDADFSVSSLPGLTVSFSEMSTSAFSFSWDFGDGQTTNVPNPVHTYSASGAYSVRLIARNDCGSDTMIQQVFASIVSLENQLESGINCSPNPFDKRLSIEFLEGSANGPVEVRLLNVAGQIVFYQKFGRVRRGEKRYVSPWLSAGIYLLEVEYSGVVHRQKVMQQ